MKAYMAEDALEGEDYRLSAMGGIVTEVKHRMRSEIFRSQCVLVFVIEERMLWQHLGVNFPVIL